MNLTQKFHYNKYHIRQFCLVVVVFLDCVTGGSNFSFSATLFPQLQDPSSPIHMTSTQEAIFASFLSLFCIPGTFLGVYLVDRLGRKWCYALVAFVNAFCFGLIAASTQVWHLLVVRSIFGINLGISYPACMCFISEIVSYKYRGLFFNVINIGIACGQLLVDVLGSYYPWRVSAIVVMCFPIMYFIILLNLKNTHVWHLNRKDFDGAKAAYFWYNDTSPENTSDFDEQVRQVGLQNAVTKRDYWEACKQRNFWIPLLLLAWMNTFLGLSGGYDLALYSIQVMKSVVTFDEYLTTIYIDILRILAAILTAPIIKLVRIRVIINSCVVLCVVSLLVLCAGMFWKHEWEPLRWVTLASLLFYTATYNIGIINMSNVCLGELFTGIAKPLGVSLTVMYLYGINFAVAWMIPTMLTDFGNVGTFMFFACSILIGGIGLYLWMPETRNVTNEQISQNFMKKTQR